MHGFVVMPEPGAAARMIRIERVAQNGSFGEVCRRARELAAIREAVSQALPAEEARHLVGVSATSDRLVLFADSATWCTRLRYRTPQLETAAARVSGRRPRITFRTLPATPHSSPAPPRGLSNRAAASLRSAARSIGDPALAEALRRLADS